MNAQVQIQRVNNTNDFSGTNKQGKSYTVYEFDCEGFINGNPTDSFTVKTLSGKMAKQVESGEFTDFDAEVDTYNGKTSYKIPQHYYKNDDYGGGNSGSNSGGGNKWGQKPAPAQSNYTLADIKALYKDIYIFVESNIANTPDVLTSATATMFIQATREGIKAPAIQSVNTPSNPEDTITNIKHLLRSGGLLDRVVKGEVPDNVLEDWYESVDGNDTKFVIEANKQLTEHGL